MQVRITDLRLSFAWTATFLDILLDPQPQSKLVFLGRRFPYEKEFTAATPPAVGPQGLERPWRVPPGQPFWSHYLDARQLPAVKPAMAWRALVPFRKQLPLRGRASWWEFRMVFHGFFYPHGIALVIDVSSRAGLGLEETVGRAMELRTGRELDVQIPEGVKKGSLAEIANDVLGQLGTLFLGRAPQFEQVSEEPFTVFTPVEASDGDADLRPFDDLELHKALEGVTSWNVHWKNTNPTPQKQAALPIPPAPDNHVLYGTRRGRAVWFPHDFAPTKNKVRNLSVFHRDLVLTSMQVDSLSGLLKATSEYQSRGEKLQIVHRDCARVAAGLVGRLYGQVAPFESSSPRYQMNQNGYVDVANRLRASFNMSELHP